MSVFHPTANRREHGAGGSEYFASTLNLDGTRKTDTQHARTRVAMVMACVVLAYSVIAGRLVYLANQTLSGGASHVLADAATAAVRPDLKDRNGQTLATDIKTFSLYGEPRRVVDADEAVELLSTVLPDIDIELMHKRLTSGAGFVWLQRELSPKQRTQILGLGVPGIGFRAENRRFYPNGQTAAHIVGHVNIDNVGTAGMEKYVDDLGLADLRAAGFTLKRNLQPVNLSIDLRVQHFVHDELMKAMDRYGAIGVGAVVLNVHTGEILAMASVPDYDPNAPAGALKKESINRMTAGLYEMGSTFKAFTVAMALDSGQVHLSDRFDATKPLQIAGYTIKDFHAKRRWLTVPEIFIYSSNIGAAKLANMIGIAGHREFLHRLGLLDRLEFELPEVARPSEPKKWTKINSVTISYGHGVQTTPLQTAIAGAALVNGGKLVPPTLFPRQREVADMLARQVLRPQTSDAMRDLLRLNVLKGSGRRAAVEGYRVGGKTGTAEKVVNGKYVSDKRFNAFLAAFPIDDPQYVVLAIVDEPKPEEGKKSATAGLNAAPLVGAIIRRSAAVLGVEPTISETKAASVYN